MAGHEPALNVQEINRAGVEISRLAAGSRARVFASIGPSGKLLVSGEIQPEQLHEAFSEQARALAEAGAAALVIETMCDLEEATIAVTAARTTGLPIVACMVFDTGKQKDRTMMGNTPEQAAEALTRAGADVIGANCGQGIAGFVPICSRLRAATDRPIWIKPNAGLPTMSEGRPQYSSTPADFVSHLRPLLEAGAQFVGGCCGTAPAFISEIRRFLRKTV
jgi:methionine synthase I (cobalamin-dependent)